MTCVNRQNEEIFGYWPQQNLGPKIYLFSTTSQLYDKFEGQYLRRETRYKQSGNRVEKCEGSPTSPQNFMNFGPLTAKTGPEFSPTLRKFCISSIVGLRTRTSDQRTQPNFATL